MKINILQKQSALKAASDSVNILKNGFDLQLFADPIPLPKNPSKNLALAGRDFLIYLDIGTDEAADWFKMGGQRDATRNLEGAEIDTSNKSDDGWGSFIVGLLTWSLDVEVIATGDALGNVSKTMAILNQVFRDRGQVHLKFEYPDKSYEEGWAVVTTQPISAPQGDVATISTTFKGVGPLSELKKDEVTP